MKKLIMIAIIIITLIISSCNFGVKDNSKKETILKQNTANQSSIHNCVAIVTKNQTLCNKDSDKATRDNCNVQILIKKSAEEKDPKYCGEITLFNESEAVKNKEPYQFICETVATEIEEIDSIKCEFGEKTCSLIKKFFLNKDNTFDLNENLTITQKDSLLRIKAIFFQDPDICKSISDTKRMLNCEVSASKDLNLCQNNQAQ